MLRGDVGARVIGWSTPDFTVAAAFVSKSWTYRVRDRGLAVVDGHMIVDAHPRPDRDGRHQVLAVRWVATEHGLEAHTERTRASAGKLEWTEER